MKFILKGVILSYFCFIYWIGGGSPFISLISEHTGTSILLRAINLPLCVILIFLKLKDRELKGVVRTLIDFILIWDHLSVEFAIVDSNLILLVPYSGSWSKVPLKSYFLLKKSIGLSIGSIWTPVVQYFYIYPESIAELTHLYNFLFLVYYSPKWANFIWSSSASIAGTGVCSFINLSSIGVVGQYTLIFIWGSFLIYLILSYFQPLQKI